jgi:hypothetical protein
VVGPVLVDGATPRPDVPGERTRRIIATAGGRHERENASVVPQLAQRVLRPPDAMKPSLPRRSAGRGDVHVRHAATEPFRRDAPKLSGSALRGKATALHQSDTQTSVGLVEVVGRDEDRPPPIAEVAEVVPELGPQRRIETDRRLI